MFMANENTVELDHLTTLFITTSEDNVKKWSKEFSSLEKQIDSLIAFITPKTNVHGEIKKLASALKSTHIRLKKLDEGFLMSTTTAPTKTVEQQTSPSLAKNTSVSRAQVHSGEANGMPSKQKNITLLQPAKRNVRNTRRKEKPENTPPTTFVTEADPGVSDQGPKDPAWQQVETKKTKKKKKKEERRKKSDGRTRQRSRRLRPNALVIKPSEGMTYADVLSKVKKDTTLQEVGLAVTGVRKTLSGDVLLVLNKENQDKVAEITEKISMALGEDATINARVQLMTLELTRLDGTTTKEEICEALIKELGDNYCVGADAVLSLRKAYGGMQTALLRLPAQTAKRLLEKSTIRVYWSNCRVREVTRPTKCFKCWQYGHITKNCTSQTDRFSCCIRCGEEGHKAEKCTARPCCSLCKEIGSKETNHVPGSRKCPVYEKAYQALLRKWR